MSRRDPNVVTSFANATPRAPMSRNNDETWGIPRRFPSLFEFSRRLHLSCAAIHKEFRSGDETGVA